uniref:Maestro heat-like repeat-containing protein family member 2A isoform X1 n=1 Tax=Pogona vitticeps TaxID=103695 RepID=A0ABM5EMX0_9SAUR
MAGATKPVHAKAMARELGGYLPTLLLHFQDPSPDVAKASWMAFVSCAPFLGLQDLAWETEVRRLLAEASDTWHPRLMGQVCGQLAQRKDPTLLDTLMRGLPRSMHCAQEGIRLAACQLAGVLAETMDAQRLEKLDWEPLLQALQSLCHDSGTTVEMAALNALQIIQQKQPKSQPGSTHGHRQRAGRLGRFFQWWRKASQNPRGQEN